MVLGCYAVHDPGVPVVQNSSQVDQKHHGRSAVLLSQLPVRVSDIARRDGLRGHGLPRVHYLCIHDWWVSRYPSGLNFRRIH